MIAYSVIVGALMASGKEVAGKIPKGKVCMLELEPEGKWFQAQSVEFYHDTQMN